MVEPQRQRQPLCGHVVVFFVEGGHHLGQQQDAAHGRDVCPQQGARVTTAVHALVVLQHSDLGGAWIGLRVADHEHGRDGMGHQVLAPYPHHLVVRVVPDRVHVQHPQVMQQRSGRHRAAVALTQPAFERQKHRHGGHHQTVLEQRGPLVPHHRELAGHGRRQWQGTQGCQQPGAGPQGLGQHGGQGFLLDERLAQGQQGRYVHRVFDGQMAINGFAQLVLHQAVVQTAVDARALLHQLDAVVGVDGSTCDHRTPVGHVGQRTQVMGTVSVLGIR